MCSNPETTVVTEVEYERLVRDSKFLEALKGAGVDNWSGYSYAHEIFYEWYPEYKESD